MIRTNRIFFLSLITVLLSVSSFAQANRLQDLVDARASSAEDDLESRGYVLTESNRSFGSVYGYWWSPQAKKCVSVRTSNGKISSIKDTTAEDCDQKEKDNTGRNTAIAVGVGAAAVIGAIAIAHKAHQHEDEKHYDDPKREAEFDRGYRDGLYNNSFHDYSNAKEYRDGYSAGVNQRRQETSYSSGYGGYTPYVSVADLVGARASSGESEFQSRGFRNVDGFKSGDSSYTIWWNSRTRQCIQAATVDGRYDSVTDIQTHPKCR